MAKIISENDGRDLEVEDGSEMQEPCETLGVPFSCTEGNCGTCMIDILEGEENLSELTDEETYLARDEKHRLACQCKIKHGTVKIRF